MRTRKSKPKPESLPVWEWIAGNIRTLDAVGGVKPFPDYPFAREVVRQLTGNRILIIAKSRQMMVTWIVCAYVLFLMINREPGIWLFLSKGGRDTAELVKRLKIMVRHLPDEVRDGIEIKKGEVTFPSGGRIIALPATEDAPRMHSPSGVFWDEMAFTPRSEGIWTAVKPAVDSGGRFVGVSTPNGTDNIFHTLYNDPLNGFAKHRLHYTEHPLRDSSWVEKAKKGLSLTRWKQEYEVDFAVMADRVYDEYDPSVHLIHQQAAVSDGQYKLFRGIDFGYRHPYVVWLALTPTGEMILFDEWEGENATIEEMVVAIRKIDARNGISEDGISWSACDPAGASQTDSGLSAVERLGREGIKLVWRSSEIMTGVELVKSLLRDATGRVRLCFSPTAVRTLHHLQNYRWDRQGDKPCKDDGHDHAMDALRYLIINLSGQKKPSWSGARVVGVKS